MMGMIAMINMMKVAIDGDDCVIDDLNDELVCLLVTIMGQIMIKSDEI